MLLDHTSSTMHLRRLDTTLSRLLPNIAEDAPEARAPLVRPTTNTALYLVAAPTITPFPALKSMPRLPAPSLPQARSSPKHYFVLGLHFSARGGPHTSCAHVAHGLD
jgi:hypothetical protein